MDERPQNEVENEKCDVATPKGRPKKTIQQEIIEWAVSFASMLLLAFLVIQFIAFPIGINGPSMQETLHHGERVLSEKISYYNNLPKRGDIVICKYPMRDDYIVKRVMGLPGDKLKVVDGELYRNGERLDEPYIKEKINRDFAEITVPDGRVFVMGDNRNDSEDSRMVGALAKDAIIARVIFRFWPINKMGSP